AQGGGVEAGRPAAHRAARRMDRQRDDGEADDGMDEERRVSNRFAHAAAQKRAPRSRTVPSSSLGRTRGKTMSGWIPAASARAARSSPSGSKVVSEISSGSSPRP